MQSFKSLAKHHVKHNHRKYLLSQIENGYYGLFTKKEWDMADQAEIIATPRGVILENGVIVGQLLKSEIAKARP